MPRVTGVSNIGYTGAPGSRTARFQQSGLLYGNSRQLMISRANFSSPYVFLQSFDGGRTWITMPDSQITTSMISAAGNPQINDMRVFHSLGGEMVWVYQIRQFVFDPVFQAEYTLYFHFSRDNGVTWSANPVTMSRGTSNEINSLTMHNDRANAYVFGMEDWILSFPDSNQTWGISENGTNQYSSSLAVTATTKIEQNEFDAGRQTNNFVAIVDKAGSNSNSNQYSNIPTFAALLQYPDPFTTGGIIYPKASAFLDTSFAILGFFNGYRLQQSSDVDGSTWTGQGDVLNFEYTLNQGTSPLSFHLLPLIEDEINDQKWFLPYIIAIGGISAPYSYSIGSVYDNTVPDTEIELRFSNCPRFSADRAAKSVLMMADNKLYHVQGRNSYNQLPLLKLLTTFTGTNTIFGESLSLCEYVGPRFVTANFDRNPDFVDGSIRGWTVSNNAVSSLGFPPQPLGQLVTYNEDNNYGRHLKVEIPPSQLAPTSMSTNISYQFDRPFWWQGAQNSQYQRTLFTYRAIGQNFSGGAIQANIKLTTNGILSESVTNTITAPTVLSGDRFGSAIGTGSNYIAVGAPFYNNISGNVDVGIVHLYDNDGNYIRSIDNPDPTTETEFGGPILNQFFGSSIVIAPDTSTQTPTDKYLIVGSPFHNTRRDLGGGNFLVQDTEGQVYVFDIETGGQVNTLIADIADADALAKFGASLFVTGDILYVGAPGWNSNVGKVFVFDLQTGQQIDSIENPNPSTTEFGYSIISQFGSLIISAPNSGTDGKVYSYNMFGGYTLSDTISSPDIGIQTGFGESIASNGIYMYIGAPKFNSNTGRVYVYFRDFTTELVKTIDNPEGSTSSSFGKQLLLSDSIYISAPTKPPAGSGVVYAYAPPVLSVVDNQVVHSDLTIKSTLINPNAFGDPFDDNFGAAMAFSLTGILISAPGEQGGETKTEGGVVYFYQSEDLEIHNQNFITDFSNPGGFDGEVLLELPGAVSSGFMSSAARLDIDVFLTNNTTFRLVNLKLSPIPIPGPIESAEAVFKFNYNSFTNLDPNLPVDLSPNGWTAGSGTSGQSGLSIVPSGGPYDASSYYRNNNADNSAGIETLKGSTGIGTYWDNNLLGQSWTFDTNIRLNSDITVSGINLMKSVGVSSLIIRQSPLNNTIVQIILQYASSSANNSGGTSNVVQFDKSDFDVGPWHHLVIEYFRASDTGRILSVWLNGVRASNTVINTTAADDFYSGSSSPASYEGITVGSLPFGGIDFGLDNTRLLLGTPYRTVFGEGNFTPPTKAFGDPTPL